MNAPPPDALPATENAETAVHWNALFIVSAAFLKRNLESEESASYEKLKQIFTTPGITSEQKLESLRGLSFNKSPFPGCPPP